MATEETAVDDPAGPHLPVADSDDAALVTALRAGDEAAFATLIDRYGFRANHIYAMSYDGTLNTQDGVQSTWPGDGTAYRIHGDLSALSSATPTTM